MSLIFSTAMSRSHSVMAFLGSTPSAFTHSTFFPPIPPFSLTRSWAITAPLKLSFPSMAREPVKGNKAPIRIASAAMAEEEKNMPRANNNATPTPILLLIFVPPFFAEFCKKSKVNFFRHSGESRNPVKSTPLKAGWTPAFAEVMTEETLRVHLF